MKSFVVISYYQLLHAIAMTLELGEKSNLFFSTSYVDVDDDTLSKIRETGVFNEVIGFDQRTANKVLREELKHTRGMAESEIDSVADSLFERILTPFYSKVFADADRNDDIYVYNDFQPHYYYIDKYFDRIVGVEDGYGVLEKHIGMINRSGIQNFYHGRDKTPFVGKYWPEMQWKSKKVKIVITSKALSDDAPEYLKKKVKIIDYHELVRNHETEHKKAIETIFDVSIPDFSPDSSMILTQPLSRNKYCTEYEDFLIHRKMINEELTKSSTVYVKPHPADRIDYAALSGNRVIVLDRRFPAEMLCEDNIVFGRVVSFMSSTTELLNSRKHVKIVGDNDYDRDRLVKYIKEYIAEEETVLDFYLRVKECTPQSYINLYLLLGNADKIRIRVNVLSENDGVGLSEYYDICNAKSIIQGYIGDREKNGQPIIWGERIKKIPEKGKKWTPYINFYEKADISDIAIAHRIADSNGDFAFVCDINNPGLEMRRDVLNSLKEHPIQSIRALRSHTIISGIRFDLGYGICNDSMVNTITNKLVHVNTIRKMIQHNLMNSNSFSIVNFSLGSIDWNPTDSLFIDEKDCLLLKETCESFSLLLHQLDKKSDLSCLLLQMAFWCKIKGYRQDCIYTMLQSINVNEKLLVCGMYEALVTVIDNNNRERNRLLYKNERVYRYARNEIDNLMRIGIFERIKKVNERKTRIKRRIRKAVRRAKGDD